MKSLSRSASPQRQQGALALVVALMLPVLVGSAAFAVDLAYLYVVRSEMQNDADAAALAGARALVNPGSTGVQWAAASTQAQEAVRLNRAAGQTLVDAQVSTGYWNLQSSAPQLQPLPMSPTAWDVPAVSVILRKQQGENQGPVQTFFARFWQVLGLPQQVQAIAAPTSPGTVWPGGLFPLAVSQCLYDTYWDRSVSPPRPRLDPATGLPYVFKIGSGYHYTTCSSGEWSALLDDQNDVGTIAQLIAQGNTVPMQMGQNIWIVPGSKAALYNIVKGCSAAGDRSCEYVVVPTVTQTDNHALAPITGFACLRIRDANNGQKYVLAEMSNRCEITEAGGIGPQYGVLTPPSLVR